MSPPKRPLTPLHVGGGTYNGARTMEGAQVEGFELRGERLSPQEFRVSMGLRVLKRSKHELGVQSLTLQPTDWLPAQESVSPTLC